MRNINQKELNEILKDHKLWLEGKGGKCANLSDVDLRYTNLNNSDLRYVNLRCTNLSNANLKHANLKYADLNDANLKYAKLKGANLRGANLKYAKLKGANLRGADLEHAKLTYADLSKANLSKANLSDTNLEDANLTYAKLKGADLEDADLKYADLIDSNLRYVNLIYTDLRYANLEGADLTNADLSNANLVRADLSRAKLKDVKTNINTLGYNLACPEEGSFIGYKKANKYIIKLLVLEDAKRSSATSIKCRCDKAKVLEIRDIKTGKKVNKVNSDYDSNFIYRVGEIVTVSDFDDDRWNECSTGIHFFVNKDNAIKY